MSTKSISKIWPADATYRSRFLVPDITPQARPALATFLPRVIFVGESPHKDEVSPPDVARRVPFSGMAGRSWWKLIGEVVAGETNTDRDLERVLRLANKGRFVLINAVQFPVGDSIVKHFPNCDPVRYLGFTKTGRAAYHRPSQPGVAEAIDSLKDRLASYPDTPIVCLGRDALWFVEQTGRSADCIPHPACWWRSKKLRQKAEEGVRQRLSSE